MRLYIQVPAIILFGFILTLFLPWYTVAFVAFVFGYLLDSESNLLGGFLGVAILWAIKIFLVTQNGSVDLAEKVARILTVDNKWLLVALTLFIGGLVGALACATGAAAKMKRAEE